MIRVAFVCLGNICRSPMAEAVFQRLVDEAGLTDRFEVDSAGTGRWHVGEAVHPGTQEILRRNGILYDHRARRVARTDVDGADYLIAMDSSNHADLLALDRAARSDGRLRLLLEFASQGSPVDVPDPYYEDNFDAVFRLVEDGCRGLLAHIRSEHDL